MYCVVFNCSDDVDHKIMGRLFAGLAQQGAWACLDHFNHINIEVLSVVSQQIMSIQQEIVKKSKEFDFEGQIIALKGSFGVFITMNLGYDSKTVDLPDNLKSLFRPIAMLVPDHRLITEIILVYEGFRNALSLSNKIFQLHILAYELLSKQSHYDFGLRAVKKGLLAAGQLRRKEPETSEDVLVMRAMRDSNLPKLIEQDIPLFTGILSDLFPGIKVCTPLIHYTIFFVHYTIFFVHYTIFFVHYIIFFIHYTVFFVHLTSCTNTPTYQEPQLPYSLFHHFIILPFLVHPF